MEWLWKVDWAGVFEPKHGLLELFLRGTIMYLAIVVLLRVVVRRHLGGIGMTDEVDIGLFMKRARVGQELFGDANFHADRIARLGAY